MKFFENDTNGFSHARQGSKFSSRRHKNDNDNKYETLYGIIIAFFFFFQIMTYVSQQCDIYG